MTDVYCLEKWNRSYVADDNEFCTENLLKMNDGHYVVYNTHPTTVRDGGNVHVYDSVLKIDQAEKLEIFDEIRNKEWDQHMLWNDVSGEWEKV